MEQDQDLSQLPDSIRSLIPFDSVSIQILQVAKASLLPPIFNHSLRVFLLATRLAQKQRALGIKFTTPSLASSTFIPKPSILFAASLFHDMGTCSAHNGPARFEVEGADAAVAYLRSQNVTDERDLHSVWCAIALHTSAGIAERIDPFTQLVRMGVKADFSLAVRDSLDLGTWAVEIEMFLPRMEIEICLAEAVVEQAVRGEREQGLYVDGESGRWTDSQKFPKASWPGALLRGHLESVRDGSKELRGPNPAF